jgi:hypothetical protein
MASTIMVGVAPAAIMARKRRMLIVMESSNPESGE